MTAPSRPVLRWHGGKWLLAPWILKHIPPHRTYVEPFGGAASVLLRKAPSYAEIYNDLDGEVVNLFRILRKPEGAARLIEHLKLTPFAREEFHLSYLPTRDAVERARRLIVRSFMGFGSNAHATNAKGRHATGFRACARRSGTTYAHDWRNYPDALRAIVERLRGVQIECRTAAEVIEKHDDPATMFYLDPPYLHETRASGNRRELGRRMYRHEMVRADHAALLEQLRGVAGMVVLSGYPDPLYDEGLPGWRRVETSALADGARPRTEVLWLNPACVAALDAQEPQGLLFEGVLT